MHAVFKSSLSIDIGCIRFWGNWEGPIERRKVTFVRGHELIGITWWPVKFNSRGDGSTRSCKMCARVRGGCELRGIDGLRVGWNVGTASRFFGLSWLSGRNPLYQTFGCGEVRQQRYITSPPYLPDISLNCTKLSTMVLDRKKQISVRR